MTFGEALNELEHGQAVRRELWSYVDETIYFKVVTFNGFKPALVQYSTDLTTGIVSKYPGAVVDYDDMIADDWEVVD